MLRNSTLPLRPMPTFVLVGYDLSALYETITLDNRPVAIIFLPKKGAFGLGFGLINFGTPGCRQLPAERNPCRGIQKYKNLGCNPFWEVLFSARPARQLLKLNPNVKQNG